MLSDDARDTEAITAAELNEGDVISIIYDPQLQNRALEFTCTSACVCDGGRMSFSCAFFDRSV